MKPLAVIDGAVAEHNPRAVYAMFSGGHDSLCSTHIAAQHPAFTAAVHINTGIGIEQTREFVRATCASQGWPLMELRTDPAVYRQQVLSQGFPAGDQRHSIMYRLLKERRVADLVRQAKVDRYDRVVLVAGARRQESQRRMGTTQYVNRQRSAVWVNPILDWSHADKHAYMEQHALPRNPVVEHLHMSGECLCGSYANMPESHELEQIEFFYPQVAWGIRMLERDVFMAGKWPNWGQFRPTEFEQQGEAQPWLPLCQDCPTRWAS